MRIAIVDDRQEDRLALHALLERYGREQALVMEPVAFSSAEALLAAFTPGGFDLLFLDIYMTGITGMDAARRLTKVDPHCRMIFFTTSHAHAVESYEVRAAYYLTKPLDYPRLVAAMEIACADLQKDNRSLALHCAGLSLIARMRDVWFVDCAAEHTRLHLEARVVNADEKVSELAPLLAADDRFLNCNRNIFVNMDQIVKTQEDSFLLKSGEAVPIRQRNKGAVKKAFLEYSLRSLRKENGL